jgi:hypothetical protein
MAQSESGGDGGGGTTGGTSTQDGGSTYDDSSYGTDSNFENSTPDWGPAQEREHEATRESEREMEREIQERNRSKTPCYSVVCDPSQTQDPLKTFRFFMGR